MGLARNIVRRWRTWNHGRKFAKKGKKCRFYGKHLHVDGHVELGVACRIRDYCIFRTTGEGKIIVGDRSGFSWFCVVEARERVEIGYATGIAERVVIRDTSHLFYGTEAHFYLTPLIVKPVKIGDEVMIGSGTYISPGVTIGNGAIIGVNSVLREDTVVGPYEIWAGVPAKKLAHRTKDLTEEQKAMVEWLMQEQGIREDHLADKL